jgi:hypothetical protein
MNKYWESGTHWIEGWVGPSYGYGTDRLTGASHCCLLPCSRFIICVDRGRPFTNTPTTLEPFNDAHVPTNAQLTFGPQTVSAAVEIYVSS